MFNLLKKIKYPKFLLLFITFIAAYALFYQQQYGQLHDFIISSGYIGIFVAGILYSDGFTAAFATSALLILANHQNIYLAAIIGGFGSLFTDLILFGLIRHSFKDEIEKLSKEKFIIYIYKLMPNILRKCLLPFLACIVIASPLPDEIGVTLLATIRTFPTRTFSIISFALNTIGIFAVLLIGRLI